MIKILQLIPAPESMRIRFLVKERPEESWAEPLACLALGIDDDGETRVIAITACDCGPDFDGTYDVETASIQMGIVVSWKEGSASKPGDE